MKYLISLDHPDILLIQETKMEKDTFLHVSAKFWKKGASVVINSRGASGGIGTLWDEQKFEVVDIKYSSNWILTLLKQKDSKNLIRIFNIFVPSSFSEKKYVGISSGTKQVICRVMSSLLGILIVL